MINIANEFNYLILNIRAFISFKIKCLVAYIFYGHFFRKRNFDKYKNSHQSLKIHFGSTENIKGFYNSQIIGKNPIDITKKLPFSDNIFSSIFTSHVVEHLHKKEFIFFLNESFRILNKEGINIISTPSLSKISKILYSDNDQIQKEKLLKRMKKWSYEELNTCEYFNGIFRNYGHRFILDFNFVELHAKKIGYKEIILGNKNNIPDLSVKEFILKNRNDESWLLETDFYFLIK